MEPPDSITITLTVDQYTSQLQSAWELGRDLGVIMGAAGVLAVLAVLVCGMFFIR